MSEKSITQFLPTVLLSLVAIDLSNECHPKWIFFPVSELGEEFTFYGLTLLHEKEKVLLKKPGADLSAAVNDFFVKYCTSHQSG